MKRFNVFTVPSHAGTELVEREEPNGKWVQHADLKSKYKFLSEEFLQAMDEIGQHGYTKHGENSSQARIMSGKIERIIDRHQTHAIMHHARLHTLDYESGVLHDHFQDLLHQLAAVAYNAMMEAQLGKLVNDKFSTADTREDEFLQLNRNK